MLEMGKYSEKFLKVGVLLSLDGIHRRSVTDRIFSLYQASLSVRIQPDEFARSFRPPHSTDPRGTPQNQPGDHQWAE
jgi:hypothetical protein